ncbi:MAG TPA: hypothetical protein VGG75_05675 [Trebonia sp.]|jgi:hypothetical protein
MVNIKPVLKPEGSIVAGIATMALVGGLYIGQVGPISDAHATDANDGNMNAAVKKTGWEALVAVAAITLLARDPNILILGGATIIAMEFGYRHAIMTQDGQIVTPAQSSYIPAGQPGSSATTPAAAG